MGSMNLTHPGLDIIAGALPFLGRGTEAVGAGMEGCWGGGDASATRCRLVLRADEGDSVTPWPGLVLVLRFRALGTGVEVDGIGGGAGTERLEAEAEAVEDAAWLAA